MSCSGDATEICGGPNAISLYSKPSLAYDLTVSNGYAKQACIQEVAGRALSSASTVSSSMTIATCTAFCKSGGYKYAGLEYVSGLEKPFAREEFETVADAVETGERVLLLKRDGQRRKRHKLLGSVQHGLFGRLHRELRWSQRDPSLDGQLVGELVGDPLMDF
jgi:hypothetical protein